MTTKSRRILFDLTFKRKKNLFFFLITQFLYFISAILEGTSFALILIALTSLSGGSVQIPPSLSFLSLFEKGAESTHNHPFTFFIMAAVGMQILRSCLTYISNIIATFMTTSIQTEIQKRVYSQILRMSFSCVSRYKVGDLAEYVKTPSLMLQEVVDAFNRFTLSILILGTFVWIMFSLSPSLTIFAGIVFGTFGLFQKILILKIARVSKFFSDYLIEFSKETVQNLHALKIVHIFSRQEEANRKANAGLELIAGGLKRLYLWHHLITPVNEVLGVGLVGLFLLLGQSMTKAEGESALPILVGFITILYRLNGRIHVLLSSLSQIALKWGLILRLQEILNNTDKEFTDDGGQIFRGIKSGISFKNLSFSHQDMNDFSLKNLNLEIQAGSTVAFVGHSGAGKSSLVDLLLRLYNPISGSIEVDGVNCSEFELHSWREAFGVVTQDNFIFNETIFENIRFGKIDASMSEIEQAAQTAGAHQFIQELPNGYETVVGERGYRLSGGERQRIALARALVRNPQILVLDEATSNLDSQSESLIQYALHQFRGIKTVLIVAHRLSTIVDADQIVVLDKGAIIEKGNHHELLVKNGKYAHFWNIQTKNDRSKIFSQHNLVTEASSNGM